MYRIKLKALKFNDYKIECISLYEKAHTEFIEISKQVFWLNIINYMTIVRIAEIILMKPEVLKSVNCYAMWQAF